MSKTTRINTNEIQVGNILTLEEIDDSSKIIKEKVTEITNKDSSDPSFQIRTENLDFDFTNFYSITEFN
jgi:hypothetical protein